MSIHTKQDEDGSIEAWADIGPETGRLTVEQLRAAAEIPETWEQIDFTSNRWESMMKGEDGVPVTIPLWQSKGRFKPPSDVVQGLELLLDRVEGLGGKFKFSKTAPPPKDKGGTLLEISPADLHMGMYAWAAHTGARYDLEIASRLFVEGVGGLLLRSAPFHPKRIALVFGNDYLHIDNQAGTTTSGTFMPETSGTFHEIAAKGIESIIQVVEMCRNVCPVDIIVVVGNHDQTSSWWIGQILKAWYRDCEDVDIDDNPSMTKYYRWGSNLIGFNHGKLNAKELRDLALQMARDVPELWAATMHQEWHLAHIHSSSFHEIKGVRVRHLPSLVATNNWHHDNNFRGQRRACEGFLWGFDSGYMGHLSMNVDPEGGRIL